MRLGRVGLGRMAANMALRLVLGGPRVAAFDPDAAARTGAAKSGVAVHDSSHGPRSASVSGRPARIFATLAGEWKSCASASCHPRRRASSAATVDLPQPETPVTTIAAVFPSPFARKAAKIR